MQEAPANILTRDDTFFGVCEALGEDFGFNANYLRIALGVMLLFNPVAVIGGYALAGVVVGLSRLLVPNPRPAAAAAAGGPARAPAGGNDNAELAAAA